MLAVLATAAVGCAGPSATGAGGAHLAPASGPSDARLAEYVDRLALREGLSAAVLVTRNGRVVVDRGYGRADDATDARFSPATVVGLASLSKQVTAAAIMRLVDLGRLRLDDDLAGLLPQDRVPADKAAITVHQLLGHTSGLGDHVLTSDLEPLDRRAALDRIFHEDLAFAPGTAWKYSNAGYTVLAAIVERVGRRPYADFVQDELFARCGVRGIAAWNDARFAGQPAATGYFNGASSGPVDRLPGPYWTVVGNGDLAGTTHELLRWFDALRAGRVVGPASTEAIFTAHPLPDGTATEYGYGWEVSRDPVVGSRITHNGGGITGNTILARYPDLGLTVVVLGNRITYRTLGEIPLEVRLPADETATAIATAVATDDLDVRPRATWDGIPYAVAGAAGLLAIVGLVLSWRRRARRG